MFGQKTTFFFPRKMFLDSIIFPDGINQSPWYCEIGEILTVVLFNPRACVPVSCRTSLSKKSVPWENHPLAHNPVLWVWLVGKLVCCTYGEACLPERPTTRVLTHGHTLLLTGLGVHLRLELRVPPPGPPELLLVKLSTASFSCLHPKSSLFRDRHCRPFIV